MPSAPSLVAADWERMEWLATQAQKGDMVNYSNQNGFLTRRDVVNNADILAPLITHLGTLPKLCEWICLYECLYVHVGWHPESVPYSLIRYEAIYLSNL